MKKYLLNIIVTISIALSDTGSPQFIGELTFFAENVGPVQELPVLGSTEYEIWGLDFKLTGNYDEFNLTIIGNNSKTLEFAKDAIPGYETFSYGKYSVLFNGFLFYLDYRFCGLSDISSGYDIWIKFDGELNEYSYRKRSEHNYTILEEDTVLKIWELYGREIAQYCFEPLTPENFSVDFSLENPYLSWDEVNEPPDPEILYEVHRRINNDNWATVITDYSSTSFTDENIASDDECSLQYRVRSLIVDNQNSEWSDVQTNTNSVGTPSITLGFTGFHPKLQWSQATVLNGTKYKVFRKYRPNDDGGGNWTLLASGLTGASYTDYSAISFPKDYVFHYKVKAYVTDCASSGFSNLVSFVGSHWVNFKHGENNSPTTEVIPEVFGLYHNSPNPFNPSTTIRYDLPVDADVTVAVYDMVGREVKILVHSPHSAGRKSVVWDGTDAQGNLVSNGVYFYRLATNGVAETRKMLLMK